MGTAGECGAIVAILAMRCDDTDNVRKLEDGCNASWTDIDPLSCGHSAKFSCDVIRTVRIENHQDFSAIFFIPR